MNINKITLWNNDIENVLNTLPELSCLENKSVLVTGAGGLICSAFTELLLRYDELREDSFIQVYAAGRSEKRMRERFGDYADRPYFHFVRYDATDPAFPEIGKCDYIVHGAGNAYPGLFTREPVETMCANFAGMKALLDFAGTAGTKRVLYISSSEVYGRRSSTDTERAGKPYVENEYGFVDLLNPRSCYSVSKRAAETLCVSYASEYGIETVIARPGFIYGPTASEADNRVSSAWAYQAARGEDIVMLSEGLQKRNYNYCLDCASAILKILLCGETMHAYNIASDDTILEIRQLGEMLAEIGDVKLVRKGAEETERKAFNPMENSTLDSRALSGLGWKAFFSTRRGLEHTVSILRDRMDH